PRVTGPRAVSQREAPPAAGRPAAMPEDDLAQESASLLKGWLASPDAYLLAGPAPTVFSRGDANLANALIHDGGIRFVDFEYAGRSDAAFDLGDIVEHVEAQRVPEELWTPFLARFLPDAAAWARFHAARRLAAHFWLTIFRRPP